jgi:hypothetical protein
MSEYIHNNYEHVMLILEFPGGHRIAICNLKSRNYTFLVIFFTQWFSKLALRLTPDELSLELKGLAAVKLVWEVIIPSSKIS